MSQIEMRQLNLAYALYLGYIDWLEYFKLWRELEEGVC